MNGTKDYDERGLGEYHARQAAATAESEAQAARNALAQARAELRDVRERLKRVMELLDRGAIGETREEVLSALAKLEKLRV